MRNAIGLPAVTVWQPWASLIIAGFKPYEFRGRPAPRTLQGKRIVIHAGARPMRNSEIMPLMEDLLAGRMCGGLDPACLPMLERAIGEPGSLPLSAGLGTALMGRSVLASVLWPDAFRNDSDRLDHANYALPLSKIERWEPIVPARGMQGWWKWQGQTR